MLREGNGYACQDPDCRQHGVVVYPEPPQLPTVIRRIETQPPRIFSERMDWR